MANTGTFAGRKNPNAKYAIDDCLLQCIDTEAKAYLLGWIASDGTLGKNGTIQIFLHPKDTDVVLKLRDIVCPELPIKTRWLPHRLVGISICSKQMVADACRWLGVEPGKKSGKVAFPCLSSDALTWAFVRGFFDGDGSVADPEKFGKGKGWPTPRATIASASDRMVEAIREFCGIPCSRRKGGLEWNGANAIDFLSKLYDDSDPGLRLFRKWDLYVVWTQWVPALGGPHGAYTQFKCAKTRPDAVRPFKARASDSGYDLVALEKVKTEGDVEFYDTGIKVQPAHGWYFAVAPRSSISKTGYMLANSVGIVDRAYTGSVKVPLRKIDKNAPDLTLPARVVQLIPMPIIHMTFEVVDELDETARGTGGFGSTGR